MAQFQIGTAKPSEVKKTPTLPKAILSSELVETNGMQCIRVVTDYPIPADDQVIVNERKGKKTAKVDNSDKIVSVLTVIGKATKVGLTMVNEAGEEVALIDGNGNQLLHTSKLQTLVKGEGADDDDDDEEETE